MGVDGQTAGLGGQRRKSTPNHKPSLPFTSQGEKVLSRGGSLGGGSEGGVVWGSTSTPKYETLNTKRQTLCTKDQTPNTKHQTPNT
jgi:hypothetical protein